MNTKPKPDGWSINGYRFDGIVFHKNRPDSPDFIEVFFNQEEHDAVLAEVCEEREGVMLYHKDKISKEEARDVEILATIIARVSNPAGEIP